jgi:hypothetical protein
VGSRHARGQSPAVSRSAVHKRVTPLSPSREPAHDQKPAPVQPVHPPKPHPVHPTHPPKPPHPPAAKAHSKPKPPPPPPDDETGAADHGKPGR